MSPLERIAAKVRYEPSTGCLVWTGGVDSRGYGRMHYEGRKEQAHRVVFFLTHGRWPKPGMVVDHRCNVKPCVNPDHLRELTQSANIMRCYARGTAEQERVRARWRRAQANARARKAAAAGGAS